MQHKNKENNVFSETFGGRLRKARKDRGLSQSHLALMLGYKNNVPVSTLETNKTSPDLKTLVRISECLDVDLHWLITGECSQADRNLQGQYGKLLGLFAKYLAKTTAQLLEHRVWLGEHIAELKASGENVEKSVISEYEADLELNQQALSEILTDQPWVLKALESLGAIQENSNKSM